MISFIMMAKNVDQFIEEAITSLKSAPEDNWELIAVDDGSTDTTYELLLGLSLDDERIKVYKNPSHGKVSGTNFGYTKTSGDIIKCIDSDDCIDKHLFKFLKRHETHDVLFHSGTVVDKNLKRITVYHPNLDWMEKDFYSVSESLISFPKWSWSFNRLIAEKIFPIPEDLPFEDVWFSLMCKKHSVNPGFSREPLYLYRQHKEQTFGGILNFSRKAVKFRSERLLKLIDSLKVQSRLSNGTIPLDFTHAIDECEYICGRRKLSEISRGKLKNSKLLYLILSRWCPNLLSGFAVMKWKLEARRKF